MPTAVLDFARHSIRVICLALLPSIPLLCQSPGALKVDGDVKTPMTLTAADLTQFPQTTATFTEHGQTASYEGALLYDILVKAGVPFGRAMIGKPMASYLVATGRDGYQVVFALPEVDPAFEGSRVIVAAKRNGEPLPAREQPARLIVPQDKMHARSIYSVLDLKVVRLRPE